MVQIRVSPDHVLPDVEMTFKKFGSGGIRTHASEETGALNQRLRPLGHATLTLTFVAIENLLDFISRHILMLMVGVQLISRN